MSHSVPSQDRIRLIASSLCLGLFALYCFALPPDLVWGDGPELAASAWILGVPHPTGYSLYMLAASLFQRLPVGTIIFRTHVFSAVCGALSAYFLFLFLARLLHNASIPSRTAHFAAAMATLAYGLNPIMWEISTQTEVYALMALLFTLTLYSLPPLWPSPTQIMPLFALAAGLQCVHHRLSLLLVAAASVWIFIKKGKELWQDQRWLVPSLAAFSLPLLCMLYFPIRAASNPAINWYDPDTLARWWDLISGTLYSGIIIQNLALLRYTGWGEIVSVILYPLLTYSLLVFFIAWGQISLFRKTPGLGWFLLTLYTAYQAFMVLYRVGDWQTFMLPSVILITMPLAMGLSQTLDRLDRAELRPSIHRLGATFGLLVSLLPVCLSLDSLTNPSMGRRIIGPSNLITAFVPTVHSIPSRFSANNSLSASRYAGRVWSQTPERAMIITGLVYETADNELSPLLYQQIAEGWGEGSVVVGAGFLYLDWYREQIGRQLGLDLPARQDQRYNTREESLRDTWETVILPSSATRPVVSPSFPLPTDILQSMQARTLDSFLVDLDDVPSFYQPYIPKGYLFLLSSKIENQGETKP